MVDNKDRPVNDNFQFFVILRPDIATGIAGRLSSKMAPFFSVGIVR
jgi:hypothetical protein